MQPIVPPIKPGESGPLVANLQDAILALLKHQAIKALDAPNRPTLDELNDLTMAITGERQDSAFKDATCQLIKYFQVQQGLGDNLQGEVEDNTAKVLNKWLKDLGLLQDLKIFMVEGYIRRPGISGQIGAAVAGVTVQAFDQDVAKQTSLGQSITNADGYYSIAFTEDDYISGDYGYDITDNVPSVFSHILGVAQPKWIKSGPDVLVGILGNDNAFIAKSGIIYNAFQDSLRLSIDLILPEPAVQRASELEDLVGQIIPRLVDVTLEELTAQQIDFLSKDAERPVEHIQALISASKYLQSAQAIANRNGLSLSSSVEFEFALLGFFYAFLRAEPLLSFEKILANGETWWLDTFNTALTQSRVPQSVADLKDKVVDALTRLRAFLLLEPAGESVVASLGDLLNAISTDWLDVNQRLSVALAAAQNGVNTEGFITSLKQAGLAEADIAKVQHALVLGDITGNHAGVVREMLLKTDGMVGDEALGKLAVIVKDYWLQIAFDNGVPVNSYITPEQYANHLITKIEDAAPTVALKAKIANGSFAPDKQGFKSVGAFLDVHLAFDVANVSIDNYFDANGLDGIDGMADVKGALRQLQWTRRTGANWDEARILIEEGLGHIGKLAEYGIEGLKKRLAEKIDDQRLAQIAIGAQQIRATGIGLMGYLMPMFNGIETNVMESWSFKNHNAKEVIDKYPTLRNLFGSLDTCYCEPCRSVLSPAAYYADLLNFVEKDTEAWKELIVRRPDLQDLLLSCENTEIELPHIDLVNEILENAIAFPYKVDLPRGTTPAQELGRNPLSGPVLDALKSTVLDPEALKNLTAEPDTSLTTSEYGIENWVVAGDDRRWTLQAIDEYLGPFPARTTGVNISSATATKLRSDFQRSKNLAELPDLVSVLRSALRAEQLPIEITDFEIEALPPQGGYRYWSVLFSGIGWAEYSPGTIAPLRAATLTLSAPNGTPSVQHLVGRYAEEVGKSFLQGDIFPIQLMRRYVDPAKLSIKVVSDGRNRWRYTTPQIQLTLVYRPQELWLMGLAYQSTASDRDLKSRSQNRNPLAYKNFLASSAYAKFPWTLPFDLDLTEVRALLKRAGIPRIEVLETARPESKRYTDQVIVQERLALSSAEAAEISRVYVNAEVWGAWGLTVSGGSATIFDTYADLPITDAPQNLMRRVSIILQQARLTLAQLNDVLQSRFVNPAMVNLTPGHCCDPTKLTLNVSSVSDADLSAFLERMRRFLRLQRILGWSVSDLDIAMRAFGYRADPTGNVSPSPIIDWLKNLSNVKLLAQRLNLPIEVICTWFGGFNREIYRDSSSTGSGGVAPLYDRVFQNRSIQNPPDQKLAFEEVPEHSPTPPTPPTISDKAVILAALMGVSINELQLLLLLKAPPPPITTPANPPYIPDTLQESLSRDVLLQLFANSSLLRALGLSVSGYCALRRLVTIQPFTNPETMLGFIDQVESIRHKGFDPEQLEYILDGVNPLQQKPWLLSNEAARDVLKNIQTDLREYLQSSRVTTGTPTVTNFSVTDTQRTRLIGPQDTSAILQERWGVVIDNSGAVTWEDPATNAIEAAVPLRFLATKAGVPEALINDALATEFVDPSLHGLTISSGATPSFVASVIGLTATHLDQLDRLLILHEITHLSPYLLDVAIQAFGVQARTDLLAVIKLPGSDIAKLPLAIRLSEQLQLSLDIVLAWWGGVGGSLYIPRKTTNPDSTIGVFENQIAKRADPVLILNEARTELNPPFTLPGKLASIFGVTDEELDQAIEACKLTGTAPINLKGLSDLYRVLSISKALAISVADLIPFAQYYNRHCTPSIEPLLGADPEQMLAFVNQFTNVRRQSDIVIGRFAQTFGLDVPIVHDLLWEKLSAGTTANTTIELFLDAAALAFADERKAINLAGIENTEEGALVFRLHKFALLNATWRLSRRELAWLPSPNSVNQFKGLALNDLQRPTSSNPKFENWHKSADLISLARRSSAMRNVIDHVVSNLAQAATDNHRYGKIVSSLSLSFDIPESDVEIVSKAGLLEFGNDTSTKDANSVDPINLRAWIETLILMKRLAVNANDVIELIKDKLGAAARQAAIAALRQRVGEDGWLNALRESTNELRIEQRDRLVDFLLAREGLRDANALYERYLIDVEMAPCMLTTRLLQSTQAVQLYVQRCLMNLEQNVPPNIDPDHRWEWMKNYRVWEANRKVFLYPENWLFPEVRDDQTSAFRCFAQEMTASELNEDSARKNALGYLSTVKNQSSIVVRGLFEYANSESAQAPRRLLVVGFKESTNSHYWRECIDWKSVSAQWTGWEPIQAGNIGDYVIPFAMNGNPYIAWPTIRQVSVSNSRIDHWEINFEWCALDKRPKKAMKISGVLTAPIVPNKNLRTSFSFKPSLIRENIVNPPVGTSSVRDRVEISCYCIPAQPEANGATITPYFNGPYGSRFLSIDGPIAEAWIECKVRVYVQYLDGALPLAASSITMRLDSVADETFVPTNPTINTYTTVTVTGTTDADGYCTVLLNLTEQIPYWPLRVYRIRLSVSSDYGIANTSGYFPTSCWCEVMSHVFQQQNDLVSDQLKPAAYTLKYRCVIAHQSTARQPTEIEERQRIAMEKFGVARIDSMDLDNLVVQTDLSQISEHNLMSGHGGYYSWGIIRDEDILDRKESFERMPPSVTWASWSFNNVAGEVVEIVAGGSDQARNSIDNDSKAWHYVDGVASYYVGIESAGINDYSWTVITDTAPITSIFYENSLINWVSLQNQTDLNANTKQGQLFMDYQSQARPRGSLSANSLTTQGVHFEYRAPDSIYNWEAFYHVPVMLATTLSRQHRFEDALRWFHFIFDPTTNDSEVGRERFWRFLPFRTMQTPATITEILEALANSNANQDHKADAERQVAAWLQDPFNPFAVARMRTSAFEWTTVIDYIRTLIAWGDQLFRRDTRESINEATLLYVLAAKILGRRPESTKTINDDHQSLSYRDLVTSGGALDGLGNSWVGLADTLHGSTQPWGRIHNPKWDKVDPVSSIGSLYFCILPNEKLPELWDLVEDRLFKIRHCQNVDGITRSLPLFDPPIDPELLIRAKAAGLDLADVLADRYAAVPYYRFQILLQKANEFCNEVKGLGSALLSAIEKKEAEHLGLLRSQQEIAILKLVESIKEEQIKEAQANIDSLKKTRSNSMERFTFLQRQLGNSQSNLDAGGAPIVEQSLMVEVQKSGSPADFSSLSLIQSEIDQVGNMADANIWSIIAGGNKAAAGAAHFLATPFDFGKLTALGHGLSAVADGFGVLATNSSFWERRASLFGGWLRRRDEWVQQSRSTAEEIRQIDKQLAALEIRKTIAEKELENHRQQIENASNIDDYLRHLKFSGESLYAWTESQLSGLYFTAYQLAYELAKRAERAYRKELGDENASFVQFGHWDNLHKGLLSGDRLSQNLRRMEAAYLDQNRREFEITKHVSLLQLDSEALLALKYGHSCEFELPEALFDMEFPGHYFRRIKSVSISIPCVTGPYAGVSATLTLLSSRLRRKDVIANNGKYAASDNLEVSFGEIQSVATTTGQNDSGLFELNFRDERYLPFEGAGIVSRWRLELSAAIPQFDYSTISDVIMHVRYTARDGGEQLREAAIRNIEDLVKQGSASEQARLFSIRHEFPTEWAKFTATPVDGNPKLKFEIGSKYFPYWAGTNLAITNAVLFIATDEVTVSIDITNTNSDSISDLVFANIQSDMHLLKGTLDNSIPARPISLSAGSPPLSIDWSINTTSVTDLWLELSWKRLA